MILAAIITALTASPFLNAIKYLEEETCSDVTKLMICFNILFYFIALHELTLFVSKYMLALLGFIIMCPIAIILVIHFSNSEEEDDAGNKEDSGKNKLSALLNKLYQRTQIYDKDNSLTECCAICLELFDENSKVIQLNCDEGHIFHAACLEKWVVKRQQCPLCRHTIAFKENDNEK